MIKTDTRGLVRDPNSKAVIVEDEVALTNYLNKKNQMKKMKSFENDICELKNEISDIKKLLLQIINRE